LSRNRLPQPGPICFWRLTVNGTLFSRLNPGEIPAYAVG